MTKKGEFLLVFIGGITGVIIFLIGVVGYQRPSTPPICDQEGNIIPGSIAVLEKVELGGMDQWILARGDSDANPVLLWLHGGPGSAQMPVAGYFNGALEKDFVVVHWDQRGAGKSNPSDFDERTMTFERFIQDAHELTQYLKERLKKDRIYLVGHSWGSQIGIKLAQAYPEDYYAYIAVSQVIAPKAGDTIGYNWLLAQAREEGNRKAINKLQELGAPPYTDHDRFVRYIKMVDSYGGSFDVGMLKLIGIALQAREYEFGDYVRHFQGANRGSGPMWKEEAYASFNAILDVEELQVPVYFFSGRNDYNTPLQLVEEYCKILKAPLGKEVVIFEDSAHTPFMAEPERFNRVMVRVKEETY